MAIYRLFFKPSAIKELRAVPISIQQKIDERIRRLAESPRPTDCTKLTGYDAYRIRVGDYRVIYLVDDKEHFVRILKIRTSTRSV